MIQNQRHMSSKRVEHPQWIAIKGSRYRGVLSLVSADSLDVVALYFLDKVLEREVRLEYLGSVFGLPSRVVEDILADLLKQGRITLNLVANQVRLTNIPARGRLRKAGPEIEIWQDDFSGALLPMDLLKTSLSRRDPSLRFPEDRKAQHLSPFLDLPDAQILATLRPLTPEIRSTAAGWIPDCFLEKEFLGQVEVFLPLAAAKVERAELFYVDAPELPRWLTKAWSKEISADSGLSPQKVDEAVDRSLMLLAVHAGQSQTKPGQVFDKSDFHYYARVWYETFMRVLNSPLEGTVLKSILHSCERATGELEAQLRVSSSIALASSSRSHVHDLWQRTSTAIVVVSDEWTSQLLAGVAAETVVSGDRPVHIVLIDAADRSRKPTPLLASASLFERAEAGEVKTAVLKEPFVGTFCLVDGRCARIGSLKSLLSKKPAIEITGMAGIEALTARIPLFLGDHPGDWWILSQLETSDVPMSSEEQVRVSLLANQAEIRALIDSTKSNIDLAAPWGAANRRKNSALGEKQSIREINIELATFADQVFERLCSLDVQLPIPISSPFEILSRACEWMSLQSRQHDLDLFIPGFPSEFDESIAQTFKHLISNGTRVRVQLTHPASNKSVERLKESFANLLTEPLFRWSRNTLEIPSTLIIDGRTVCVSSGNWLSSGENYGYGMVFESVRLAGDIFALARSSAEQNSKLP